jgi:hypothetical protein
LMYSMRNVPGVKDPRGLMGRDEPQKEIYIKKYLRAPERTCKTTELTSSLGSAPSN